MDKAARKTLPSMLKMALVTSLLEIDPSLFNFITQTSTLRSIPIL